MPQLDVSTFPSQLFWLFISFTCLYIFTQRVTMPRLSKILDARRQRIEASIHRADELKKNADKIRQEFEDVLNTARNQAHDNVMQMINRVAVESSQSKNELNVKTLESIKSSELRIEKQKTQALDEIKEVAEKIATLTVEKFIGQKIDSKSVDTVINELFSKKVA